MKLYQYRKMKPERARRIARMRAYAIAAAVPRHDAIVMRQGAAGRGKEHYSGRHSKGWTTFTMVCSPDHGAIGARQSAKLVKNSILIFTSA